MAYIDEAVKRSGHLVKAIEEDRKIPIFNKKLVLQYIDFMQARGLSGRTVNKNLYCFAVYLKAIGKTDVLKATRSEIEAAMARIEGSAYAAKTKQNIKITIKSLYKHFLGEDLYYPKQVAWIKSGLGSAKRLLPEDILSEEEMLRMLDAVQNQRDKAIIALLFDAGIRVGELLSMRVKDVELADELAHITVNGKTGMRRIPIMFSVPFLAQYLNAIKDRKGTDMLWNAIGTWSNSNKAVDYSGIRSMLKLAGRKAGIEKRIYPHLFRHSRASNYANKLTEQQLKVFFGWTGDSRQAATYVHLSGRDIDNAVLQAHGMKPHDSTADTKLKVKQCPRCQLANTVGSTYCTRCGSALDVATAVKQDEMANLSKDQAEEGYEESKNKGFARRVEGKKKK